MEPSYNLTQNNQYTQQARNNNNSYDNRFSSNDNIDRKVKSAARDVQKTQGNLKEEERSPLSNKTITKELTSLEKHNKIIEDLKQNSLASLTLYFDQFNPNEKIAFFPSLSQYNLNEKTLTKLIPSIINYLNKLENLEINLKTNLDYSNLAISFIEYLIKTDLKFSEENYPVYPIIDQFLRKCIHKKELMPVSTMAHKKYFGNNTIFEKACNEIIQASSYKGLDTVFEMIFVYGGPQQFSNLLKNIIKAQEEKFDPLNTDKNAPPCIRPKSYIPLNKFDSLEQFLKFRTLCVSDIKYERQKEDLDKIETNYMKFLMNTNVRDAIDLLWAIRNENAERVNVLAQMLEFFYFRKLSVYDKEQLTGILNDYSKNNSNDVKKNELDFLKKTVLNIKFFYGLKCPEFNFERSEESRKKLESDLWNLSFTYIYPIDAESINPEYDKPIFYSTKHNSRPLIFGFISETDSKKILRENQFLIRFSINNHENLVLDYRRKGQVYSIEIFIQNMKSFKEFINFLNDINEIQENVAHRKDIPFDWKYNLCDVHLNLLENEVKSIGATNKSGSFIEKTYKPKLFDLDLRLSNRRAEAQVSLLTENLEFNIQNAAHKEVFRISFLGTALSGKSDLLTHLGDLFNCERKPVLGGSTALSTTSGLDLYYSRWEPNPDVSIALIDTEGLSGLLPTTLDEKNQKKWKLGLDLVNKNNYATVNNRPIEFLRTDAIENTLAPLLINTSDIVIFVTIGSLSSISFRDRVFKLIQPYIDRRGKADKPVLLLISNEQNDSSTFDRTQATNEFMSIHDPRSELLLYFSKVLCFRLPLRDSLKETYMANILEIKKIINESLTSTLKQRKERKIKITEKIHLRMIQNVFNQIENGSANLTTLKLLNEVITPPSELFDIIRYQFFSLLFNNTTLKPSKTFKLGLKLSIMQLIQFYTKELLGLKLEDKNELIFKKQQSETYINIKERIRNSLKTLKEFFEEYEPCSSTHHKSTENITFQCGLSKTEHTMGPLNIHSTFFRVSDILTWPKQKVGPLAWKRARWINPNNQSYIDKFRPQSDSWFWDGKYTTSNLINVPNEDDVIDKILNHFLNASNVNENHNKKFDNLTIDPDTAIEVFKAMNGNIKSTEDYPFLPCFVCFKTAKEFTGDSKLKADPVIAENSPLICCPECNQKLQNACKTQTTTDN